MNAAIKKKGMRLFVIKLMIFYSVALLLLIAIKLTHQLTYVILLSIAMGLFYAHATGLQHEATHGAITSRPKNQFIGKLLGIPLLNSFTDYQVDHMRHHMFLGTSKNNELFAQRDIEGFSLVKLLTNIFMIPYYQRLIKHIKISWTNRELNLGSKQFDTKASQEYRLISLFIVAMLLCACLNPKTVLMGWLLPVVLVGLPIRSMIEIAEHFGCDTSTTDVYENTRVIPGRFANWLTNGNNYHVVHHLYPGYPLSLVKEKYNHLEKTPTVINSSYIAFYFYLFRRLLFIKP